MARGGSLINLHRLINESTGGAPVAVSFLGDLKRSVELEEETYNNQVYDKKLLLEKVKNLIEDCSDDEFKILSSFIKVKETFDIDSFESYISEHPDKKELFSNCIRKSSNCYKPSSMNCIRNMYFQRIGAQKDNSKASAERSRIGESGTAAHEYIQKHIMMMKKNGMDCEYIDVESFIKMRGLDYLVVLGKSGIETKLFDTRYNLRFMCDGIIRYKGRYYILEIKTEVSSKSMGRDGVDPEHQTQASAYSLSLGLDEVIFLYESRDFCTWKCYLFKVTKELREELVVKRIQDCDKYVGELKVPPMPIDAGKKLCRYCDYASLCKRSV